ncbi:MAG: fumarylacetoacetate hydrolase [Massilia sp.]|nr:fumarylacetoacetate hydrolase [Massilia sp.]
MTDYVIIPPTAPSLAVQGSSARFPLRRVFCVGRNYAAHAREMGNDPDREPPFFFMKPADAVVPADGVVPYPACTSDLHYEVEMVVALSGGGSDVDPADALALVWGYGVGIDLTLRDLQAVAKQMSRPWDFSKGFDASAPCSALRPVANGGHPPESTRVALEVNGAVRQEGTLDQMIWPLADIISTISRFVALAPGDLIFTGTPAGVGALLPGDRVRGVLDGVAEFAFEVGPLPKRSC